MSICYTDISYILVLFHNISAEKKKVTPMKENPKKARTKETAPYDKEGACANDTQAKGEDLPEEAMTIRGGVFTREDLLVDISQRLKVMRRQETSHYTIPDYLKAEFQQKLREAAEAGFDTDDVEKAAAESNAAVPSSVNDAAAGAANNGGGPAADGSSSAGGSSTNATINELWREKICEWCYQVVDHFDFNREVVSVALNYLDRYLATRTVNRRIFQLAAMTALYLAIKLFEPGKLRMRSLIDLSRGYFLAEHIITMEKSMLKSLRWHVHPPTSFAFCRDFMRLVSGDISPRARHDVNELARFMTELSVCDYWFITKKPSSIALAALINAIELQGPRRVNPRYKVEFLHRVVELGKDIASDDEIIECYERLREMYIAGGYTPNLEEPSTSSSGVGGNGNRVTNGGSAANESPTGLDDGPAADDLDDDDDDDDLSQMECV